MCAEKTGERRKKPMFVTIEEIRSAMEGGKYITDRSTAVVLFLSLKLGKPVLVEGEAGHECLGAQQ